MSVLDWCVLTAYFLVMLGMGLWARTNGEDRERLLYGGWCDAVVAIGDLRTTCRATVQRVFVAYAAIAYTAGFSIYIWWACSIAMALVIGCNVFPARWSRLRQRLGIISPLEYLVTRYDLPTQQVLAWSGALLKVFDVGAKWTAAAILLQVFAGVPALWGVLLTGTVTLA